jgi:DNA polymerase III epsilon subunit-like protein
MICIMDYETSGFSKNHAVELAAVVYTPDGEMFTYHSKCKPSSPIEDGAYEVHKISNAMVANERSDVEVVEEFWKEINDLHNPEQGPLVLGGHNSSFDMRVLRKYVHVPADVPVLCTLKLGRLYSPEATNHKLVTLHDHLGCKGEYKAHSALDDVYMSFNILKHYMDKLGLGYLDLATTQSKPVTLKVVPFGKHKGTAMSVVPADYMRYMLGLDDLDADVKYNFTQELLRRGIGI